MEKEVILEDIFDKGFATHTFDITSKIQATIKTLTTEDYLALDNKMIDSKGTKLYIMQLYGLNRLSHGLVSYREIKFATPENALEFLKRLPATVVDKMLQEQSKFEKTVKEFLDVKELEDVFFGKGGLQERLEQSPKESDLPEIIQ